MESETKRPNEKARECNRPFLVKKGLKLKLKNKEDDSQELTESRYELHGAVRKNESSSVYRSVAPELVIVRSECC